MKDWIRVDRNSLKKLVLILSEDTYAFLLRCGQAEPGLQVVLESLHLVGLANLVNLGNQRPPVTHMLS